VKALHLEPGVRPGPALLADLACALDRSARWHGTPAVRLARKVSPALRASLRPHLARAAARPAAVAPAC